MTKTINKDVKRPSLWFGVEIEVCAATNPERHLKSLDFDHWISEPDISIFPQGREFISPIFEWENRGQVFDVVETRRAHGAHCNQTLSSSQKTELVVNLLLTTNFYGLSKHWQTKRI